MQAEAITLRLSHNEAVLLGSIWNEVVNGFSVSNFERTVGISETDALAELYKLRAATEKQEKTSGPILVDFAADVIPATSRAIELTMRELGQEEFSTRVGFELREAGTLRDALKKLLPHSDTIAV